MGLLLGATGKAFFDRKVTQATAVQVCAESDKTHAESGKFDADAAQIIAQTAVSLVAPLQSEITKLTGRVEKLETENLASQGENRRLKHYIKDLLRWIAEHVPHAAPPPAPSDMAF